MAIKLNGATGKLATGGGFVATIAAGLIAWGQMDTTVTTHVEDTVKHSGTSVAEARVHAGIDAKAEKCCEKAAMNSETLKEVKDDVKAARSAQTEVLLQLRDVAGEIRALRRDLNRTP